MILKYAVLTVALEVCSKVVDMRESDLPSLLLYTEPAAASEQREMLKFAQIQAFCFMAQMKLDEASTCSKPDAVLVNTANNLLQRAEEIDREEGMIVIMRGQVQMLLENYQAARMTFQRAKAMKVNQTKSSVTPHMALAQVRIPCTWYLILPFERKGRSIAFVHTYPSKL